MRGRLKRSRLAKLLYRCARHPLGRWLMRPAACFRWIRHKGVHLLPKNRRHNQAYARILTDFERSIAQP